MGCWMLWGLVMGVRGRCCSGCCSICGSGFSGSGWGGGGGGGGSGEGWWYCYCYWGCCYY